MTHRSAPLRSTLQPAVRTFVLLLTLVLFASGCARMSKLFKDEDANEGVPVEQLYDEAHTKMTQGNWASAETIFKRLVAQYPYGDYTEQALVETAYAQYKAGKHEEAISSIDRFLRTYPTHRMAPLRRRRQGADGDLA